MIRIKFILFGILVVALTTIICAVSVHPKYDIKGIRAAELELAMFRTVDSEWPHCYDEPMCWERAGVNKITGDQLYICGACGNFIEPIWGGKDFVNLILTEEEYKVRRSGKIEEFYEE